MHELTFVRFEELTDTHAILTGGRPQRFLLPRGEIDPIELGAHPTDAAIRTYFQRTPEVLVLMHEPGPDAIRCSRTLLTSHPGLRRLLEFRRGEPVKMLVRDTNTPRFAYAELDSGLEARIDKYTVRSYFKERLFLPRRTPEGLQPITADDLRTARTNDEAFWSTAYMDYELYPGDTVIGCVYGALFEPKGDVTEETICLLVDLPAYLQRLSDRLIDIFPFIGFTGTEKDFAVRAVSDEAPPIESIPALPGVMPNLLLVDNDGGGILKPFVAYLEGEGFHVTTCTTVEAARRAVDEACQVVESGEMEAEAAYFTFAVIDIHLSPTGNDTACAGLVFAQKLSTQMPSCSIILVSGAPTDPLPELAGDLRILTYLRKPFSPKTLRGYLRDEARKHRILARYLFVQRDKEEAKIEDKIKQTRAQSIDTLRGLLEDLVSTLKADSAFLFRMHRITREAEIVAHAGPQMPGYKTHRKTLRYSPVRNVCEAGQEIYDIEVSEQHFEKHRNLLRLFDRHNRYLACTACSVPHPPGEEFTYGLFVFRLERGSGNAQNTLLPWGFDVDLPILHTLPENEACYLAETFTLLQLRKYAAFASQHLLKRSFSEMETRQHPMLVSGMANASMGHEIANSLTGASSAIARLRQVITQSERDSEQERRLVEHLEGLINRVSEIARDCRKVARAHKEELSEFDVVDAIRASAQTLTVAAGENHTEVFLLEEPHVTVKAPRTALERIIFNVMLNAVQQIGFSLRGKGMVQARHFLSPGKKKPDLIIQIFDNGPGIHGFMQTKVFDPGETTRPDGSGMGLSICRSELKNMGEAQIVVAQTVLFCGTCVEITIPGKMITKSG